MPKPSLEETLTQLFEENEINKLCTVIIEESDKVIDSTSQIVPKKALVELTAKYRCNWPWGSGIYSSYKESQFKSKFRERWKEEEKLLELEFNNIDEINKLWSNSKDSLEERYHRKFNKREDLAIMFAINYKTRKLKNMIDNLKEVMTIINKFDNMSEVEPNSGFEESKKIFEKYVLVNQAKRCANSLINLNLDMSDFREGMDLIPEEIKLAEYSLLNYREIGNTRSKWINSRIVLNSHTAKYLSSFLIRYKEESLSFSSALELLYPKIIKEAGFIKRRTFFNYYHDIPKEITDVVYNTLKFHYDNIKQEDEVSKFMSWYTKKILERWKATAVDHERLFDYYEPNVADKKFMSIFWSIKEGKYFNRFSEEKDFARLPEILNAMIENKLIAKEQIQPPLKDKYLTYNEIVNNLNGGSHIKIDSDYLKMNNNPQTMLPLNNLEKSFSPDEIIYLPTTPSNDNSDQRKELILSESKTLFKGINCIFISDNDYSSKNNFEISHVYRLNLLPQESKPEDGALISTLGREFKVIELAPDSQEKKIRDAINDVEKDVVPINSYTLLTNISPEEFKKKYLEEFMAHAALHMPNQTLYSFNKVIETIRKADAINWIAHLGLRNKIILEPFEIDNHFGFQIKDEQELIYSNVLAIVKTLSDYIRGVGLSFYEEVSLDEEGREIVKQKLADRRFLSDNLERIVETLQDDGLPKILSFLVQNDKYYIDDIYDSLQKCNFCEEYYIAGRFLESDSRTKIEDKYIDIKDLHDLSVHPEKFIFKDGNLRNIYELINNFNSSEPYVPIFFEYSELIPKFVKFAEIFKEYVDAKYESYRFYGTIKDGLEGSELEKVNFEENQAKINLEKTTKGLNNTINELQGKYNNLSNNKSNLNKSEENLLFYWKNELKSFRFYQICHPESLNIENANPDVNLSSKDLSFL